MIFFFFIINQYTVMYNIIYQIFSISEINMANRQSDEFQYLHLKCQTYIYSECNNSCNKVLTI